MTTPGTLAHGDGAALALADALAVVVVFVVARGVQAITATRASQRIARSSHERDGNSRARGLVS
jgi:hypothetical protein